MGYSEDYDISLGVRDQFSSVLQKMEYQMALVKNATSDSVKELDNLERTARSLSGASEGFKILHDNVKNFVDVAKLGGQTSVFYKDATDNLKEAQAALAPKIGETTEKAKGSGTGFKQMALAMTAGSLVTNTLMGAFNALKNTLVSIPQQAMAVNASFEQTKIAFTTLLGSAKEADDFLKKMWKFAATTPFDFPGLTSAARTLKAFGFATEEILPLMESVGNISSALGGSTEIVGRMTYNLGQMNAMGRVTGRELRDLAMAGVNLNDVYAILAKNIGKTTEQVKAMMNTQRGATALPIDEFLKAFKEVGTSGKFLGAMEAQAKTFNGAISTIKDNIQGLLRDGFKPIFDWVSRLTYQFSLFTQSADFEKMTANLAAGVGKLTEGLPNLTADAFAPLVEGATKALDVFIKVAAFVKDNLTPIIVGLGAAATLTLVAITATLAGATGGLSLVIPTIAAGVALLTKAIEGINKKHEEQVKAEKHVIDSLGDQADEYKRVKNEIEALEEMQRKGKGIIDRQKEIDALTEKLRALEDQVRQTDEALDRSNRERQKQNWSNLGKTGAMDTTFDTTVWEKGEFFKQPAGNLYKLTEEQIAANEKVGASVQKMVQGITADFVAMGRMTQDTADAMLTGLNMAITPAEKFTALFQELINKLPILDSSAQQTFLAAAVKINDDAEATGNWTKALDELKALFGEVGTAGDRELERIAAAAQKAEEALKKAADKQKWVDMFTELGNGIAGPLAAYEKALKADKPTGYSERDFRDKDLQIAQNERKIEEAEERRRRALKQSTNNNYREVDVEAAEQETREIERLIIANEELRESKNKMIETNAEIANSEEEAYADMIVAYGEYFNKWILGQEAMGKISKEQADAMLKNSEASFGVPLTKSEEFARAYTANLKLMSAGTNEISQSWMDIVAQSLKAEDPAKKITELTTAEIKKQQELKQVEKDQQKILKDNALLGEDQPEEYKTQGQAVITSFVEGAELEFGPAGLKFKAGGKSMAVGLMTGYKELLPDACDAAVAVTDAMVGAVLRRLEAHSPSQVFADIGGYMMEGLSQGVEQDAPQPVETVSDAIQHILNLFSGISVDPRLQEAASTISNVLGAFASAVDVLTSLKDYTSPARDAVDAAFADMHYITGRLINMANDIIGAYDWGKMGDLGSAANNLLGAFATALEGLRATEGYVRPSRAIIDGLLDDMMYIVQQLTSRLPANMTEAAGNTLAGIGAAFASMLEPLMGLSQYVGQAHTGINRSAAAITAFMGDVESLFGHIGDLAAWLDRQGDLKDKMKELAPIMEAVFPPLTTALQLLMGIGDYVPLERVEKGNKKYAEKLISFMGDVESLFGHIGDLAAWLDNQGDLGKKMATLGPIMGAVFTPLLDIMEFLEKLNSYTGLARPVDAEGNGGPSAAIEAFTRDLFGIFGRLGVLAEWLANQSNAAGRLAPQMIELGNVMASVFGGLSIVMDTISMLGEYAENRVSNETLVAVLDEMRANIVSVINALNSWMTGQDVMGNPAGAPIVISAAMIKFAGELSSLLAPLQTIIDIMDSLFDTSKQLADGASASEEVFSTMGNIVRKTVETLREWMTGKDVMGNPAGAPIVIDEIIIGYANKISRVLAPMQGMVAVAKDLLDYSRDVTHNSAQITAVLPQFFLDMKEIVQQFVDVQWPDMKNLKDETISKVQGIVQTVQASVGLLIDLRTYIREARGEAVDIPTAIVDVVGYIQLAVDEYIKKITTITGIDDIEAETAQAVGNIVSAMGGAVELFAKLKDYERIPKDTLTTFAQNLGEAVDAFLTEVAKYSALADPATSVAATTTSDIVSALIGAAELFEKLLDYVDVPQTSIKLFMADLQLAVTEFLGQLVPPIQTVGAEKAGEVAVAVQAIVNALGDAVGFFYLLGQDGGFKDVPNTQMVNLKRAMVGDDGKGGIVARFKEIYDVLNTDAYKGASDVAEVISAIVKALSDGVDFFRKINDFKDVPDTAMENIRRAFMGDANAEDNKSVLGIIAKMAAALSKSVRGDIALVSSAMATISETFYAAAGTLTSIAGYSVPLPAKFVQFANDLLGGGEGGAATIGVLGLIERVAVEWDENAVSNANIFKTAIEGIKQPLFDAMAALTLINTNSGAPIAAINNFLTSMNTILSDLQTLSNAAAALDLTALMTSMGRISLSISTFFLSMQSAWRSAGSSWIYQLVQGISGAVDAYLIPELRRIGNLMPHSPAKEGPLREPVNWESYLLGGLDEAASDLGNELGRLRSPGAPAGLAAAGAGNNITITITGNTFSDQAGMDRMLRQLTDALRRQGVSL